MKKNFVILILCLLGMFSTLVSETANKASTKSDIQEKQKETSKQKEKEKKAEKASEMIHYEISVTATRTERDTFEIPKPVSVISDMRILEAAPNNITDLLYEMPGVDVNGVGANQSRPVIRGLRGQRILLLEDGMRMNSSRRQQDFGEIPALVDVAGVNRVEVVRGPASVLYGSDAIGGVINIITKIPDYGQEGTEVHGNFGYRYGSADQQQKGNASVFGHIENFGFMVSGTYRNSKSYEAPSGSFGEIDLTNNTVVNDSGVQDNSFNVFLGYRLSNNNNLSLKYESYSSNDAGFGYVDPAAFDPGSAKIQITYPSQRVNKFSLGYENRSMNFLLADGATFAGYYLTNKRHLNMNIFIPFGIPMFPNAGIELKSKNFTDIKTYGFRLEFTKVYRQQHILTYGADYFHDNSENTDSNTTQVVGFGPSPPQTDNRPQLPFATYRSLGAFLQDDISLSSRSSLILGLRYQNVQARTKETPGLETNSLVNSSDRTVVGAANFTYGITENLRVVAAVGRGFRSPNLIERFFDGTTPEGSGYQSRNLDLKAETSFNVDLGMKFRQQYVYLETTYFINTIYDGIRISLTGNTVNGIPEYRNVNIDRLRIQGIEGLGRVGTRLGVSFAANFTYLTSKDLGNPELPYVDTYSSKLNLHFRYDNPKDLFWIEYHIRHNGNQKDIDLGNNPIGSTIPGFTVHNLRVGTTLFRSSAFPQRVGIIFGNLTNTLYSEFSNASFFRPAPKRHIVFTWSASF